MTMRVATSAMVGCAFFARRAARPFTVGGWHTSRQVCLPGTVYRAPTKTRRRTGSQVSLPGTCGAPTNKACGVRSLEFFEDGVEGDGVAGDGGGVGAGGEFGEGAGAGGLLEDFHFIVVHRGARDEDVVVAGDAVHPGGALDGGLRRRDDWKLRKVERVAAGGIASRCGGGAGYVYALAVVPGID